MSHRQKSKLGVRVGDQYALLPLEVAEGIAWNSLPDYAARVLTALQLEYRGHNNGCLGLTASQARLRGVHHWKLYAGLKLLSLACLIICTRRGRLIGGTKLPSLYAITWKGIDEPRDGVVYDVGISVCPIPRHGWARWTRPDDWQKTCQRIAREMRGRSKSSVSTMDGYGRSTHGGANRPKTAPPMVDEETRFPAPPMVDASKTSPQGGGRRGAPKRAAIRTPGETEVRQDQGETARPRGAREVRP